MSMLAFIVAALVVVGVGNLVVMVWLTTGGRHGGTLDLTRSAARGELDLDWSDPRNPG